MRWFSVLFFVAVASVAQAEPITPATIEVTDGDTIRVGKDAYRLVGFDTPETQSPRRVVSDKERQLGQRATARLREIVKAGDLDLEEVRCSCPDSAQGTKWCNFGRKCGKLSARGQDVGAILISEGHARPFRCSRTRCPKAKPWD